MSKWRILWMQHSLLGQVQLAWPAPQCLLLFTWLACMMGQLLQPSPCHSVHHIPNSQSQALELTPVWCCQPTYKCLSNKSLFILMKFRCRLMIMCPQGIQCILILKKLRLSSDYPSKNKFLRSKVRLNSILIISNYLFILQLYHFKMI